MKQLITIFFITAFSIRGYSQDVETSYLTGKVMDKTTMESLGFANLMLLKDSVPVAKIQADMDGNYRFGPVSAGTYSLAAKYLGYPDKHIDSIVLYVDKT